MRSGIYGSDVKTLFGRLCRNIHCLNMRILEKAINILCSVLSKKGFDTQIIYDNQINLLKRMIKVKRMNPTERINQFPTILQFIWGRE